MFSRFIQVVAYISTSFLFIAKKYSIVWIYHLLFIHSSIDGCLSCLCFLAITDTNTMNVCVKVIWNMFFISLGNTYLGVELLRHVIILCLTYNINKHHC